MYGQVGFRMTFPLLMPTVDAQKAPPRELVPAFQSLAEERKMDFEVGLEVAVILASKPFGNCLKVWY